MMRTTIYAILAIAVGVTLVGVLPTQLATVTTQQGSRIFELQTTTQANKTGGSEVTGQPKTDSNTTISDDLNGLTDTERIQQEFNTNVKYYGLWVVNLVLALGVYFLAKKRLS